MGSCLRIDLKIEMLSTAGSLGSARPSRLRLRSARSNAPSARSAASFGFLLCFLALAWPRFLGGVVGASALQIRREQRQDRGSAAVKVHEVREPKVEVKRSPLPLATEIAPERQPSASASTCASSPILGDLPGCCGRAWTWLKTASAMTTGAQGGNSSAGQTQEQRRVAALERELKQVDAEHAKLQAWLAGQGVRQRWRPYRSALAGALAAGCGYGAGKLMRSAREASILEEGGNPYAAEFPEGEPAATNSNTYCWAGFGLGSLACLFSFTGLAEAMKYAFGDPEVEVVNRSVSRNRLQKRRVQEELCSWDQRNRHELELETGDPGRGEQVQEGGRTGEQNNVDAAKVRLRCLENELGRLERRLIAEKHTKSRLPYRAGLYALLTGFFAWLVSRIWELVRLRDADRMPIAGLHANKELDSAFLGAQVGLGACGGLMLSDLWNITETDAKSASMQRQYLRQQTRVQEAEAEVRTRLKLKEA